MKPILNYTTKIDAWKTLSEIQILLASHGATHMSIAQQNKMPVSLVFTIDHGGSPLNFSLPCNYKGVLARLKANKAVPRRLKTEEQALRVGWRILQDWVDAQMAMVYAECVVMEEVFLPYLVMPGSETTLYRHFEQGNFKRLT